MRQKKEGPRHTVICAGAGKQIGNKGTSLRNPLLISRTGLEVADVVLVLIIMGGIFERARTRGRFALTNDTIDVAVRHAVARAIANGRSRPLGFRRVPVDAVFTIRHTRWRLGNCRIGQLLMQAVDAVDPGA